MARADSPDDRVFNGVRWLGTGSWGKALSNQPYVAMVLHRRTGVQIVMFVIDDAQENWGNVDFPPILQISTVDQNGFLHDAWGRRSLKEALDQYKSRSVGLLEVSEEDLKELYMGRDRPFDAFDEQNMKRAEKFLTENKIA